MVPEVPIDALEQAIYRRYPVPEMIEIKIYKVKEDTPSGNGPPD